jgi:hypothetical protein
MKGNGFRLKSNNKSLKTWDWNFHFTLIFLRLRLWKLKIGRVEDVLDPQTTGWKTVGIPCLCGQPLPFLS